VFEFIFSFLRIILPLSSECTLYFLIFKKKNEGKTKCVLVFVLNRKVTVKSRILFNLQQILFTFSHLVEHFISGFSGPSYSQVSSGILHSKTVVQTVCCQKNTLLFLLRPLEWLSDWHDSAVYMIMENLPIPPLVSSMCISLFEMW